MGFFIPGANDEEQAEDVLRAIRQHVEEHSNRTLGDVRILRLDYVHDGQHLEAEVGKRRG